MPSLRIAHYVHTHSPEGSSRGIHLTHSHMTTQTLTRFENDLRSYLSDLSSKDAVKLADECDAYGINTMDAFEDAFFYQTDTYPGRADAEFAQYLSEEINCDEIPDHIQGCIDWDLVWQTHYRFDFWSVVVNDVTYYFFNM